MAAAPTLESLNRGMRSLIKDLYMTGSYGTQREAIEEARYDRFSGIVPGDTLQQTALRIVLSLYLEIADEPTHTRLQGLILDAIALKPHAVRDLAPAGLLDRPEFTAVHAASIAAQEADNARMEARLESYHAARLARRAAAGLNSDAESEAPDNNASAGDNAASGNNASAGESDAESEVANASGPVERVIKIVTCNGVAGAVTDSGRVYLWGSWVEAVVPPRLDNVIDLAISYEGALALKRDGSTVIWGRHVNVEVPADLRLKAVYGSEGGFYGIGLDNKIVHLPTADNMLVTVVPDIEVKSLVVCQESDWAVAIGLDDTATAFGPLRIEIPTSIKIKNAVIGRDFGLAILTDGDLYAWGTRDLNRIIQSGARHGSIDVAYGAEDFWAILSDGSITRYSPDDPRPLRIENDFVDGYSVAIAGSTNLLLILDTYGHVSIFNPDGDARLNVPEEISAHGVHVANEYYESIPEISNDRVVIEPTFDTMEAEIIARVDGEVMDFSNGETYESVIDYLLEVGGEACLFLYKGHLAAFSKGELARKIETGEAVFYECRRVFPFNPDEGDFGTFEPTDIKRTKFIEIPLNGRFTFEMDMAHDLFTSHTLWRIDDTDKTLPVTASWEMAITGGPVASAVHCQAGTEKRLYSLTAVKFARAAAAAAAPAAAAVAKIRRGEEVREIDLTAGANVASVKGRYAEALGVNADRVRFIFSGKILKNTDAVAPGSTLQAMVRAEGGTRRSHGRRGTRKLTWR